ncbi:hypothetical protein M501DRAFT_1002788 [Patellaria atrata CBS 101060]|uniref:Uncharacterized protein n=1 Tax=Patellaria atrata CBS 101060 TaxID=1346257 RepID=A0A9P4VSG8_9PEZI|nr:hypothetical protein M501DRAFT_1002788 [Patellaria atrata CBS 101060]
MSRVPGFEREPVRPIDRVQRGVDRYPGDTANEPQILHWRCNLTALSHVFNLFFVACVDRVHIFQPTFPHQKLLGDPDLILPIANSGQGSTQAHIDPVRPHAANRVLVDFLGHDEILLLACDDGDVIGYRTRDIQRAIDLGEGYDLSPFFVRNVLRSAWGLAVHTTARKIAVSANTHEITVFAFGLTGQEAELYSLNSFSLEDRTTNTTTTLRGHETNIPDIAFCNTGDDPMGRWLLSSDIGGITYIWNVEGYGPFTGYQHRFCNGSCNFCQCNSDQIIQRHASWGCMWLDKPSFRETKTIEETTGLYGSNYSLDKHPPEIWDITASLDVVQNAATTYPPPPVATTTTAVDNNDGEGHADMPEGSLTEPMDADEEDDNVPDIGDPEEQASTADQEEGNIETASGTSESTLPEYPEDPLAPQPPDSPILITSVRDVFLTHPYRHQNHIINFAPPPFRPPWIPFHDPLRQSVGAGASASFHKQQRKDRMSLYAYIRDLGVVVVGSPKGRAAVFVLTKTHVVGRAVYAMRLEHLLPFASEERDRQRPEETLVGVAAGPVQGFLASGREYNPLRRWRLFLYYKHHSLLAYELGRRVGVEGDDVFVEQLVV